MNPTEVKYDNRIDFLKKYLFKMNKLIFYEFFINHILMLLKKDS